MKSTSLCQFSGKSGQWKKFWFKLRWKDISAQLSTGSFVHSSNLCNTGKHVAEKWLHHNIRTRNHQLFFFFFWLVVMKTCVVGKLCTHRFLLILGRERAPLKNHQAYARRSDISQHMLCEDMCDEQTYGFKSESATSAENHQHCKAGFLWKANQKRAKTNYCLTLWIVFHSR